VGAALDQPRKQPGDLSRSIAERIVRTVMRIPSGRVATYGQVALVAGVPRRHRLVGRILKGIVDDGSVPWHRVVDASGRISRRSVDGEVESVQRERLEEEGIEFDRAGRVVLSRYRWARGRTAAKPATTVD
jgi:methylated-DNA-protein-cysteine methyltransferase related protein